MTVAEVEVIDATGLKCPMPVLRAQKALRGKAAGSRILLLATDTAARKEVPLFCEQAGYALLESGEEVDTLSFLIQKP